MARNCDPLQIFHCAVHFHILQSRLSVWSCNLFLCVSRHELWFCVCAHCLLTGRREPILSSTDAEYSDRNNSVTVVVLHFFIVKKTNRCLYAQNVGGHRVWLLQRGGAERSFPPAPSVQGWRCRRLVFDSSVYYQPSRPIRGRFFLWMDTATLGGPFWKGNQHLYISRKIDDLSSTWVQ